MDEIGRGLAKIPDLERCMEVVSLATEFRKKTGRTPTRMLALEVCARGWPPHGHIKTDRTQRVGGGRRSGPHAGCEATAMYVNKHARWLRAKVHLRKIHIMQLRKI